MRTDQAVQEDVEQELQWHPNLDTTNIAVSVKDGVVLNAASLINRIAQQS